MGLDQDDQHRTVSQQSHDRHQGLLVGPVTRTCDRADGGHLERSIPEHRLESAASGHERVGRTEGTPGGFEARAQVSDQ